MVGLFFGGTYGEEYSSAYKELEATKPDMDEGERRAVSHRVAFGSAAFEVGTELPENLFALFTAGGSKILTQPLKATVKNMLRKPAKQLAKEFGQQAAVSAGTEMVAGGGQAFVRQREGLQGPTVGEGVAESIIPALTMSLLFGMGSAGYNRMQSTSVMRELNSPNPEARMQAADGMANRIATNTKDDELAQAWLDQAQNTIADGGQFDFDEKITSFAAIKVAEDRAEEGQREQGPDSQLGDEITGAEPFDRVQAGLAEGQFGDVVSPGAAPRDIADSEQLNDIERRISNLRTVTGKKRKNKEAQRNLDRLISQRAKLVKERGIVESPDERGLDTGVETVDAERYGRARFPGVGLDPIDVEARTVTSEIEGEGQRQIGFDPQAGPDALGDKVILPREETIAIARQRKNVGRLEQTAKKAKNKVIARKQLDKAKAKLARMEAQRGLPEVVGDIAPVAERGAAGQDDIKAEVAAVSPEEGQGVGVKAGDQIEYDGLDWQIESTDKGQVSAVAPGAD